MNRHLRTLFNTKPLSKKIAIAGMLAFLICGISIAANAQVTVSGSNGANGTYSNLTKNNGAFKAINSNVQTGKNIVITITGNTNENGGPTNLGAGLWTSLKIIPAGGAWTLSGNHSTGLIILNGSDNVTIDGLNSGGNALTFSNSSTNAAAKTILFLNGASQNLVQNCSITGASKGAATGTVFFGNSVSTPNEFNKINTCKIGPESATELPTNAIYSEGNALVKNQLNEITNNHIYDFFNAALSCNGINIVNGNSRWTITGNKIYQRSARLFTAAAVYTAIKIEENTALQGDGFIISNNTIGFANELGTGICSIGATAAAGLQNKFRGIEIIHAGSANTNQVVGNIISGIAHSSAYNAALLSDAFFAAIKTGTGGTGKYIVTNNTIGCATVAASITVSHSGTTENLANISGIYDATGNNTEISGNNIAGIRIGGTGTAASFYGILVNPALSGNAVVKNNNIGTANAAISHMQTGLYGIMGIDIRNTGGEISGNTIQNINLNSGKTSSAAFAGIYAAGSTGLYLVSKNAVHSISNTAGTVNVKHYGLLLNISDNNNVVEKNFIHSVEPGANAVVTGIEARAGRAVYKNNITRFGISKAGTSITAGHLIYGILQNSPVNNNLFYYNTSYIGGTVSSGSSGSYCFYSAVSAVRDYRNNNFVNSRSGNGAHYAIGLSGTTGLTCDHNNLYATGTNGFTGSLAAVNYATLAQWQSASGTDAMSMSGDPIFTNADGNSFLVNLGINTGSICNNEAISITVSDDYNNTARDNSSPVGTPDIGAFEIPRGTAAGTWIGVIDTDWNKAGNWDDNTIPNSSTNVYIVRGHKTLTGITDMPVISSATAYSRNLNLQMPYTSVIVNGTGIIKVAGAIKNKGNFDLIAGTLELNGSSGTQIIAGSKFKNSSIKNLVINNNVDLTNESLPASPENDTLNITGSVTFAGNNHSFRTWSVAAPTLGMLTAKSNAGSTASMGDYTNDNTNSGNIITGNVTVERYISYGKKWHLLSIPTNASGTQTIHAAWQEGNAPMANSKPGYGTLISNTTTGNGYDFASPSLAIKKLAANAWITIGPTGTNSQLNGSDAYMLYIRGDRSVGVGAPAGSTILRTTGDLKSYSIIKNVTASTAAADSFTNIGNPYASAIDLRKLNFSNVPKIIYAWDPSLPGTNGLGAYQTLTYNGSHFIATPGGGAFYNTPTCNYIQSGLGFLAKGTVGLAGTLEFTEAAKTLGSLPASRTASGERKSLRMSLVSAAGNILKDGMMIEFDASNQNSYDNEDAPKQLNSYENTGIKLGSKILSVERHALPQNNDTIRLFVSNLYNGNYKWLIAAQNLEQPGLTAFFEDKYTAMSAALNLTDSTIVMFTADNNAASKASDRFRIVFRQTVVLPVSITGVQAVRMSDKTAEVKWQTSNEINIGSYEVQKSKDGKSFSSIQKISPSTGNNGNRYYHFTDEYAGNSIIYYRIAAIENDGSKIYSNVEKLEAVATAASVSLKQNPGSRQAVIDFMNCSKGQYRDNDNKRRW